MSTGAAVAAGAGVLQLTADLELALSSETALARAIREGPAVYLGATGALVLAARLRRMDPVTILQRRNA